MDFFLQNTSCTGGFNHIIKTIWHEILHCDICLHAESQKRKLSTVVSRKKQKKGYQIAVNDYTEESLEKIFD